MINGIEYLKRKYPNFDEYCYQPNGLDLQVGKVYEINGKGLICGLINGKKKNAEHIEIPAQKYPETENTNAWELKPHKPYIFEVDRSIQIGENNAQLYFPRSTLLRNGVDVITAVGDVGYKGHLSFMVINHNDFPYYITKGERFAQLVDFQVTETSTSYEGDYQE